MIMPQSYNKFKISSYESFRYPLFCKIVAEVLSSWEFPLAVICTRPLLSSFAKTHAQLPSQFLCDFVYYYNFLLSGKST